ncbi:MAG: DNA/RNA nuclease SfsA [Azospirillum sp.]|nr:DNA/RNA nuclease SfsA [Azospirillum sp.]
MRFAPPLISGRLVRRYKRFLADVVLDHGKMVTAHCPNPGAMTGLDTPGSPCWLSRSDNPARRLRHTLELIEADGGLVGLHTGHPNRIVAEAVTAGLVPELSGYATLRREVAYGNRSRVDLLLEDPARPPAYVEVKNVHLRRPERHHGRAAEFPDCVTKRGARHLGELAAMVATGCRAVLVYVVQRQDCDHVRVADDIDPGYAAATAAAKAAGVEMLAWRCRISLDAIVLERPLPIVL